MASRLVLVVSLLAAARAAGVSKDDISKYWEKDFKELSHFYGKTSDKDLYGASLPPATIYSAATTERKGIVLENTGQYEANDFAHGGPAQPYNYNQIYPEPSLKPAQSDNYFSYSDSNANNPNEDRRTNKYLNEIPQFGNQHFDLPSNANFQGFKPYFSGSSNAENDYTNIKNILSTERNEIVGAGEVIAGGDTTYRNNNARSKVREFKGNTFNSRSKCRSRYCRKKSKTSNRVYSRPIKKIKRIVVY